MLLILHTLFLIAAAIIALRPIQLSLSARLFSIFLIFELSLVTTAALLSVFNLIGNDWIYWAVSMTFAFLLALPFRYIAASRNRFAAAPAAIFDRPIAADRSQLSLFLVCLICLFAILMLVVVCLAYPSVPDVQTIKLPKIVFALESHNFLPSKLTDDGRMFISPPYPAFIDLFFFAHGSKPTHELLIFRFLNWIVCGLAIYRSARLLGASADASTFATCLALLSPLLILGGSSEGDDIIAATPLIICVYFLILWDRDGRRPVFAALAATGLGLSVGIKLFPVLYIPALVIVLLWSLTKFSPRGTIKFISLHKTSALLFATFSIVALLPHFITNQAAFGNPFYISEAVQGGRNTPFSLQCASRNLFGYSLQYLFSDFNWIFELFSRGVANKYNSFFSSLVPTDGADGNWKCTIYKQPFILTISYLNEDTVWFGILGPMLAACSIAAIVSRRHLFIVRVLGLLFLGWVVAFCATEKYFGGVGRYWMTAGLACTPIVALFFDQLKSGFFRRLGAARVLIACILGIILVLGYQTVANNLYRPFLTVITAKPRIEKHFSPEMRQFVKEAKALNVQASYAIDTYDYFLMMQPTALLYNNAAVLRDTSNVVLVRSYGVFDNPFEDPRIPVRMEKPFVGGFQYVGTVPWGLGFVNDPAIGARGPQSANGRFLLFQIVGLKRKQETISFSIGPLTSDNLMPRIRYRVGWRETVGAKTVTEEWKQGPYAEYAVPASAVAVIVEAAFDDSLDQPSQFEWPMTNFNSILLDSLSKASNDRNSQPW